MDHLVAVAQLLALAFADLDLSRDVLRDLGAEAERLVLRKEAIPLFGELRVVREVVPPPMLDRVVVRLGQRADFVFHTSRVPSSGASGHRSPGRTSVSTASSCPARCGEICRSDSGEGCRKRSQ